MNGDDENDAFEAAVPLSQRAMAARAGGDVNRHYLDDLNPAQRVGVEALDGPVLMLAGAGTGKTKALMARVAHILTLERAKSHEILAVTFTNKAAKEMKDRLGKTPFELERFLYPRGLPWMGTFHSLSAKILRRHAELAGLKSNFTILDTDDQLRLLKQLIAAANIDEKRWPARLLAGLIDSWKNRAWTPTKVPLSEASAYNGRGTELYEQYQDRLRTLNATDFGDLLLHVVTIFQAHPDVLAQYQRWLPYILVDEYQDTNVAQYLWLRLLAQGHRNICCVGDDDQSIYGWRGAEVGNILRFEKDFPGAHVVRLEQNYRSTPHILAAASGVIARNAGRLGKTLWTEAQDGEKVRLIGHWDGEEEARWIGEEVEALQRGTRSLAPHGLDDMAILVRASHQMRAFEDRFLTIGLPYRVIGGPRFYERLEIRDAMAYFRLAVSPEDDLAFERVINTPKRGLGDKAQADIQRTARSSGVSLLEGARELLALKAIGGKGAGHLRAFVDGVDRWHWFVVNSANVELLEQLDEELERLKDEDFTELSDIDRAAAVKERDAALTAIEFKLLLLRSHVALAEQILEESGYTAMWQNDKTPEAPGRLDNLKELVKALEQFDNLQGFLEHVSLIMENETEEAAEKVTIMTLHAAKGLEFPVVFLPGWEDGLFPSQRSMDESGLKGLEEERRLAYVGITRAEELCTISFAANRRLYGQWQSALPSRFIDELPADHVEVLTPPGLYGGGYGAAGMQGGHGGGSTIEQRAASANVYNSPGWKRLQDRAATRPMAQPREARNTVIDLAAVSSFTLDDRVFHVKFGYGTVTGIEGDKLDVDFDKAGVKKIVARFVVAADSVDEVPF
ncbi:UvrD-helicase domain-containing protein [Paracoccaceae bacterium Fryx2]|nr:UvrD-helicase domain-containing protein [Paracoccaceae bacterium Fryx2]